MVTDCRITLLTPHWGASPELQQFADARANCPDRESLTGTFRGLPVRFSRSQGCEVLQLNQRVAVMPEILEDVPMLSITMIEQRDDVAATAHVTDGAYAEGDTIAHVDTVCVTDKVVRVFRVNGGKSTTIEELNAWLDELIAGNKWPAELQPRFLVAA
jgi:hypothetical protein